MLERCRHQFNFYAEQHHAKKTAEGYAKAKTNEHFVSEIDQVLKL